MRSIKSMLAELNGLNDTLGKPIMLKWPGTREELEKRIVAMTRQATRTRKIDAFTISEIAKAEGIDAKVARAKLRRHLDKEPWLRRNGGWVFSRQERPKVAAILR